MVGAVALFYVPFGLALSDCKIYFFSLGIIQFFSFVIFLGAVTGRGQLLIGCEERLEILSHVEAVHKVVTITHAKLVDSIGVTQFD